jgi:integrase
MALLRWFRFLGAIEVPWEQATRVEARDFTRWVQVAAKPARPHWRYQDESAQSRPTPAKAPASPNPVTGKAPPGTKYAPATAAHSETVLRSFYEFHLEAGSGPMVNPFPLSRKGRDGRANAHHNPMEPFRNERSGLYRPRVVARAPRQIPDANFDELFAALGSHRDRALVAFWVSTGARASELLGVTCGDTDPGQQLITVSRKGSGALQQLPASPDAFVWLRLYQLQMQDLGSARPGPAVVADAAAPVPPADLSRRLPDVRPGERAPGVELVPS